MESSKVAVRRTLMQRSRPRILICIKRLSLLTVLLISYPSYAGPPQQTVKSPDCEEIKNNIKALADTMATLQGEIQTLTASLTDLDEKISNLRGSVKKLDNYYGISEDFRTKLLDTLASAVNTRKKIRQEIDNDALAIQAIKDEIASLLNTLGNCGAKNNPTPTPTPTPTPKPTPGTTNNQVGYHIDTQTANGLLVTTFDTPNGKIKVNLPDDMSAGDTITGTVECEPKGKDDAERAKNQNELNGEVIQVGGQQTKVGDKKISCAIPNPLTSGAKLIVLLHGGQPVVTSEIPISITPKPTPTQFTLPTGGQQGRPIEINGPCNGIIGPQDTVKIGGIVLPPLAESPRKIVVQNTNNTLGPTTIECNENGAKMECPFRNIGIKLSAPKLSLLRGETTTLHVTVMGLSGIKDDLPLDLINNSPSVIKMSEGDAQHFMIPHIQLNSDGSYSIERTLTGIMSGGFGITGTVTWPNVCTSKP